MERQITVEFALQETARLYLEKRAVENENEALKRQIDGLKFQLDQKKPESGRDEVVIPAEA